MENKTIHIEDLNYMVSLYCPGRCIHCNVWQRNKKKVRENEIGMDLFERFLESDALSHTTYFDLTAGESQLSSNYTKSVEIISRRKIRPFVHTNISGWYTKRHCEVTELALNYLSPDQFRLDIALDGSKETYSKIRLVENGFEKAIESAHQLKKLGAIVRFVMIIYPENYHDIPFLVNLSERLGVGFTFGFARHSFAYLNNSDAVYAFNNEDMTRIERMLNDAGWLNEDRLCTFNWAKNSYLDTVPLFTCEMGKRSLTLDPYGNLYPCNELSESLFMGNIKDYSGDLDQLLRGENAQSVLQAISKKACQPCARLCAHKAQIV